MISPKLSTGSRWDTGTVPMSHGSGPLSGWVLGIDTSTRVAVGLANGDAVVASVTVGDTRSHVELLMPTVETVLRDAGIGPRDLAAVAVGMGPGPFTGLRAGIAAAAVLAHTIGCPLYRVGSLDVLAYQYVKTSPMGGPFVVAIDARRHELYWAVYDAAGRPVSAPTVSAPADLTAYPVVGPGAALYPTAGGGAWGDMELDAGILAARARDLPPVGPEPLYLRRADAQPSTTAKSALTPQELAR